MAIRARSTAARRTAVLLCGTVLAACTTTGHPTAGRPRPRPTSTSPTSPSCAPGRGAAIPLPPSWRESAPSVATAVLTGGRTLVVLSAGFPSARYALAHVTSRCSPEAAFGDHGVARLAFPRGAVHVNAVVARRDGGALLAGGTTRGWLVAKIDAAGALDPTFGVGGWAVLPWAGDASALVETPSGRILVGGSDGAGCCVRAWLTELTPSGQVVTSFGAHGRSAVPIGVGPDSGVSGVSLAPDGSVFVLNAGGNMGCWGVSVSKLTAGGVVVRSFERRFTAAMRRLAPAGVFVADLVPRGRGFLLVGTTQPDCVSDQPNPGARGLVASFRADGELDPSFGHRGMAGFAAQMAQSAAALPQHDGTILLVLWPATISHDEERASVTLVALSGTGRLVASYGTGGVARIALPFTNGDWPESALPMTASTDGHVSVLLTSEAKGAGYDVRYPSP